jgi:hypothetical protein
MNRLIGINKAKIIVIVACIITLFGMGVIILHPIPIINQVPSTKQSCPEDGECNVRIRSYNNEVLTDITDIFPSWFPETPSLLPKSTNTNTQRTTLQTVPIVELLKTVNCREGPGTSYAIVAFLRQGSTGFLVGRNSDWSWWLIQPSGQWLQCWVWSEFVKTNNDIRQVPFATSLPPPTLTITVDPQGNTQIGCWVNTVQYPNGICLSRACGPNDYPGTPCTP